MNDSDNKTSYPLLPPPYENVAAASYSKLPLDPHAPSAPLNPHAAYVAPSVSFQVQPNQNGPVVITLPSNSQYNTNFTIIDNRVQEVPDSHLCYAIFTCLCCFWPLGLAAIITAVKCRSASDKRNIEKARQLSGLTKTLAHLALALGLLIIVGNLLLRIVFGINWFGVIMQ